MKIAVAVLFVCLAVVVTALPAKGSTKAALQKCIQQCPEDDYTPVCAGDGTGKGDKSFGNECVLNNYNCENNKDLKIVKKGECTGGGGVRLS